MPRPCIFFLLLIICIPSHTNAQTNDIDSLKIILVNAGSLEEQIKIRLDIFSIYQKTDFDSAKKYVFKTLYDSKKCKDKTLVAWSYFSVAAGYLNRLIIDSARTYIDSAEFISKKINFQKGIAKAFYFRGIACLSQNQYKESADYLAKALEKFTQLGDSEYIANVKQQISLYYLTTKNYSKALQYGLESKTLYEELNLYDKQIYALNNLGIIYNDMKDTLNAIKIWKECYNLTTKYGQLDDRIRGLNILANQFALSNQKDSAEYYYRKAINFGDFPFLDENRLYSFRNLALLCYQRGEFKMAEKYILKAKELADRTNDNEIELVLLSDLSDIYNRLNNYKKSLEYLKKYNHFKDSLKTSGAGYILDKAISDEELAKRMDELKVLKEQQASMVKKNFLLIILGAISVLLFYAYWFYQRHLFFKVQKAIPPKAAHTAKTGFWQFKFPKHKAQKWKLLISVLSFICLVLGLNIFFFGKIGNRYLVVSGTLFSGLAFYFSYTGVSLFQRRFKSLKLNKELQHSIIANISFILIMSVALSLFYKLNLTIRNLLYCALIVETSSFTALLILGLITFRENYDLVFGSLLNELNEQLVSKSDIPGPTNLQSVENGIRITIEDLDIVLDKVLYIVSENVYQEFVCLGNNGIEKRLTRKTLTFIEKVLDPYPNFIRCHRSYIVNLNKVREIRGNSRQQYLITDFTKEKITISRNLSTKILSQFKAINKN